MANGIPIEYAPIEHVAGEPYSLDQIRQVFDTHNSPLKVDIMLAQPDDYWSTARAYAEDIVQRELDRAAARREEQRQENLSKTLGGRILLRVFG